jgi:hypothetical protein
MTFLETSERILGITNKHVADQVADASNIIDLKLGSAPFDASRLIAESLDLDLATYDISPVLLSIVGLETPHEAASVTSWPISAPDETDALVLGGYPDVFHYRTEGNSAFGFAWVAGSINGKPGRNITLSMDLESATTLGNDYIRPRTPLGGISGGPVYQVVDGRGIERLELVGIIYETDEETRWAVAHPLTTLRSNGTFSEFW